MASSRPSTPFPYQAPPLSTPSYNQKSRYHSSCQIIYRDENGSKRTLSTPPILSHHSLHLHLPFSLRNILLPPSHLPTETATIWRKIVREGKWIPLGTQHAHHRPTPLVCGVWRRRGVGCAVVVSGCHLHPYCCCRGLSPPQHLLTTLFASTTKHHIHAHPQPHPSNRSITRPSPGAFGGLQGAKRGCSKTYEVMRVESVFIVMVARRRWWEQTDYNKTISQPTTLRPTNVQYTNGNRKLLPLFSPRLPPHLSSP